MSLVYVGEQRLFGEVVSSAGDESVVQIYEDSGGLSSGEPVFPTMEPMSIRLGPGLVGGIFDGIGRPLSQIERLAGDFISKGINIGALDEEKKWSVRMLVHDGDTVHGGQPFAVTEESGMVEHRSMVPPTLSGTIRDAVGDGNYTVVEPLAYVESERGERTPSVQTSISLCYALQISLNALYEDSLPEDMFKEENNTLRQRFGLLHNTLSNWVLADLPDESEHADLPADLAQLPPLGFEMLDENALFLH